MRSITTAQMAAAQRAYDDMAPPCATRAGVIAEQIRLAEECIGRAERALQVDDIEATLDLLRCAISELEEVTQ